MRSLLLFLLFTGIFLVVMNERLYALPTKVEYRYLPRDLDTYMRETTFAHVPFTKMLNQDDPFMTRND